MIYADLYEEKRRRRENFGTKTLYNDQNIADKLIFCQNVWEFVSKSRIVKIRYLVRGKIVVCKGKNLTFKGKKNTLGSWPDPAKLSTAHLIHDIVFPWDLHWISF